MAIKSPMVPVRYLAALREAFHGKQCDVDALSRASGIDPGILDNSAGMIEVEKFGELYTAIERATRRTDIAFALGTAIKVTSHDILGLGIISCANLDQAIHFTSRFFALMNPVFTLHYQRNKEGGEVCFRPVIPVDGKTLRVNSELFAVAFHVQVLAMLRESLRHYEIYLPFEKPAHAHRYCELAKVRVFFGCDPVQGVRIVLSSASLYAPFPNANKLAVAQVEQKCRALLSASAGNMAIHEWVETMLRETENHQPTLKELAAAAQISERTLDRRLGEAGVSFRELSLKCRHDRARRLLSESKMTITQIAFHLGYGDAANFSRAFRKIEGVSPQEYAQSGLKSDPS